MSYDLVIRGGDVVDGSGLARYRADVGVQHGTIVRIGRIRERGREEVDAEGHIVTPGFIDGHTHMDAQINWDPLGTSSCWNGVTTVVMGNCGFTLAPSRDGERAFVVRNLEKAEDISGAVMAAGIKWGWETFPEYLDFVDGLPKGINYAAYIGHSALRTWAMGERAFEGPANSDDLAEMENQLRDGMKAGAIGLSTSRGTQHETSDDRPVASRLASWDEVRHLVGTMGRFGAGIFELANEEAIRIGSPELRTEALTRLQALAVESGVPITFGLTVAGVEESGAWKDQLALLDSTAALGGRMIAQSHSKDVTILMSFKTNLPFDRLPEWQEVRSRPLDEQKRLLCNPAIRARLVQSANHGNYGNRIGGEARKPVWTRIKAYNKTLPPYPSIAELAAQLGIDPVEVMINLAVETDLDQFFIQFIQDEDPAAVLEIMRHPRAVMTFSDTGAHARQICDASIHSHLLAYWVRERQAFTLEEGIRMITLAPAMVWGFSNRGLLREGLAADINVIDPTRITPEIPEVVADLPAGGMRLIQRSTGIRATIVNGRVLLRNGKHTGALPGQLLRGPLSGVR